MCVFICAGACAFGDRHFRSHRVRFVVFAVLYCVCACVRVCVAFRSPFGSKITILEATTTLGLLGTEDDVVRDAATGTPAHASHGTRVWGRTMATDVGHDAEAHQYVEP